MKKMISLLAAMLLLCSALVVSVSAAAGTQDDPIICTSLSFNMVKIPAGETYYITYTDPYAAAKYQLSINSSTDKEAGYTVAIGDVTQDSDADGYCNTIATPDANYTYYFSISNKSANQATFFISFYEISPYEISDTILYVGENAVTTLAADTTLYSFEAEESGIYEIVVDNTDAILTHWNGSISYVTDVAATAVDGKLEVTCASAGQSLMIGLSAVDGANIIITKTGDYIPPEAIVYEDYVNSHTPIDNFKLPEGELTKIDITTTHTVVLGADGFYHYGTANGPIIYVDMTGVQFADLYECFYPATAGAQVADRLRGIYTGDDGKQHGYEFLTAMHAYADALDADGFYYLTADLATYLQCYGTAQGWFVPQFSPFADIQNNAFVEESAWLVSAYYIPATNPEDPADPEAPTDPEDPADPTDPEDPADPEEPDTPVDGDDDTESPATGDVASFGAMTALLMSAAGAFTFSKKRK